MNRAPLDAILFTASPAEAARVRRELRPFGVRLGVAHRARSLSSLVDREPWLVLLDLVHRAALTREARLALDGARGRARLLAVHGARLGDVQGEWAHLRVDGFVHGREVGEVARGLAGRRVSALVLPAYERPIAIRH